MGQYDYSAQKINSFQGDYRFLSNFYMHPVIYEDITYASTEHAYQAAKTLDLNIRRQIADLPRPGQAKKLGQVIKLRTDWEKVKIQVMIDLLDAKFSNKSLHYKLTDTYPAYLEEGNTWNDTFWGVCFGVGRNELGKALMRRRYKFIYLS